MKKNSNIKVGEISQKMGLGTTTVTKRIRRLREMGIIERIGAKKRGQWIVYTKEQILFQEWNGRANIMVTGKKYHKI